MSNQTQFAKGYNEALADIALKLATGDITDVVDWLDNNYNGNDSDIRGIINELVKLHK
jgi:hypothetical protein